MNKEIPLYLTTIVHRSSNLQKIFQDFLGVEKNVIIQELMKQFSGVDVETLLSGNVVEKEDKQFIVEAKRKPHELGIIKTSQKPIKRGRNLEVREKHWYEKIKDYRIAAGKKQTDLNSLMGFRYNRFSMFEIGRQLMSEKDRSIFFECIGKPIDETIPIKTPGGIGRPRGKYNKNSKPTKPVGVYFDDPQPTEKELDFESEIISGVTNASLNDYYKGKMNERERCIKLFGKFISGEIKSQWELRDELEERE